MANLTSSIIACSCNKILIGKTYASLEEQCTAGCIVCNINSYMDMEGKKRTIVNRKPGMETGVGRTEIHSDSCTAGRDWSINDEV